MLVEILVGSSVVLVLGLGLLYLYRAEPERVARRGLARTAVAIASAPAGKALTVTGRARARVDQARTLRDEPCLYVRTSVLHFFRKKGTDGNISERWKPVAEEEAGGPFELEDSSGVALVDPRGAICLADERWIDVDWRDLSPRESALLERHAGTITRDVPTKIRERFIREGETYSVFGTLERGDGGQVQFLRPSKATMLAIG